MSFLLRCLVTDRRGRTDNRPHHSGFLQSIVEQVQRAGSAACIQIAPVVMVRGVDEAEAAFAAIAQAQAEAVIVQGIFFSRSRARWPALMQTSQLRAAKRV
jgi:DNA repair photolyase